MCETRVFEPDLCYGCGKRYMTKRGVFSPLWKCSQCGAPLCVLCWQTGARGCADHAGVANEVSQPEKPRLRVTASASNPEETGDPQRQHETTPAIGDYAVHPHAGDSRNDTQLGDIFLARFDRNVRSQREIPLPCTGETIRLDSETYAQTPQRLFGDVRQFVFQSGLLRRNRLCLAAILLKYAGLRGDPQKLSPAENLVDQIAGPMGLDFEESVFYAVGIFSPVGWPGSWKTRGTIRENAYFYFVEHIEGTVWEVFGPESPWKNLFNPETASEQQKRAAKALVAAPELVFPGGLIFLDIFLQENRMNREAVEQAVGSSDGRYLIIEHKGKFAVQRTAR